MAPKKTTAVDTVAGAIKPPITFKEFSKDPVKGLLFIVLVAIGYLYVDNKIITKDHAAKQDIRIEKLEIKVDTLTSELEKVISESSATNAKLEVLESLGKIPK